MSSRQLSENTGRCPECARIKLLAKIDDQIKKDEQWMAETRSFRTAVEQGQYDHILDFLLQSNFWTVFLDHA